MSDGRLLAVAVSPVCIGIMATMADPFNLRQANMPGIVRSFTSENPLHPYLKSFILGRDVQENTYHSLSTTVRGQDVEPNRDCYLSKSILLGALNSRTGFCSEKNNFSVLAPAVVFHGKQKFSCVLKYYPTFTAGPATVRSDTATLPAEVHSHSTSAEMFGLKIVLDPETMLICSPEARLKEYMNRKTQVENSLNQTMQEQICNALVNCPSMAMVRLRNEAPEEKHMFTMKESKKDFVYRHIQNASLEFCSWTLNPVDAEGALQDAFTSMLSHFSRGQEPNCIVTTPEVADYIAKVPSVEMKSEALYTVHFSGNDGNFEPGDIRPYAGVSKPIRVKTCGVKVCNKVLPILQVPHLIRQSSSTYNTFEHEVSFWVYNEIGYNSGCKNLSVADFKAVTRTAIEVTDLHLGKDGKFTMDQCLRQGGGLLPSTYDPYQYDSMFRMLPGLQRFMETMTNPTELIAQIGRGALAMDSPYCLYFPSPKVRYRPRDGTGCKFRSAGVFGNRPSFDNWHPPSGDLEAAKDWLANKIHMRDNELDGLSDYLAACADITWTGRDLEAMVGLDGKFPKLHELIEVPLSTVHVTHMLNDLVANNGFCKFAGIPRYFYAISVFASRKLQDKNNDKNNAEDKAEKFPPHLLKRIIEARAALFRVSHRLSGLFSRVDAPEGVLTDAPASIPVSDYLDDGEALRAHVTQTSNEVKAALRFYALCIVPLMFSKVHNLVLKDEDPVQFINYRIPNVTNRNGHRNDEETFRQPYFARAIPTNRDLAGFNSALKNYKDILLKDKHAAAETNIVDVTAYDPLFDFDIDVLKAGKHSREENFFDYFTSHRFDYLRKTTDEHFMVRAVAAHICMTKYTPPIEAAIGHGCLMNRKYRIVRQCAMSVGMVGLYAGGIDNMMYGVGNLSSVTKQTSNNAWEMATRCSGNCFIVDPLSSGRVIQNAVSKQLRSGMTSTLVNLPEHLGDSRTFDLPREWWKNTAFVLEGLPGTHPLKDQHHFLPLNGRHVPEDYNFAAFDLTKPDELKGWYSENPYATRGYSEAHLVFGEMFPSNHLPLYDGLPTADGVQTIHQRATVKREDMAGQISERLDEMPLQTSFSGRSNIGFLERQVGEGSAASDSWFSKSPLKRNSNSGSEFAEALRLNCRRNDMGIRNVSDGRLQKTGVKGRYTARYIQ